MKKKEIRKDEKDSVPITTTVVYPQEKPNAEEVRFEDFQKFMHTSK